MLALLAYTLLERQARQAGLTLTTRRLIEQLDSLNIIETQALDGSRCYRLTSLSPEQAELMIACRTLFPLEPDPWLLPQGQSSPPKLLTPLTRELEATPPGCPPAKRSLLSFWS